MSDGRQRSLTDRQRAFVAAFLTLGHGFGNATHAATVAGYRWPSRQGPALTHHPAVRAAIEEGFAPILAEAGREEDAPSKLVRKANILTKVKRRTCTQ